jgi:SnoaL-like domain
MFTAESYDGAALAARAEILDRINLYFHAADRRRWTLMEHVFHDDATWNMSSIGGLTWRDTLAMSAKLFADQLAATHHQIGNTLIRIEGDQAFTELYATAYHRVRADAAPGGVFGGVGYAYDLIGALRYCDRFERRDGQWRIADRRGVSEWRHLQPAADGILSQVATRFRGQYDDTDPSTPVIVGL